MPTYLYCVRSDPVLPAEWLVGIDGGRVRGLEVDDVLAWVSDIQSMPVEANIARLSAHDAVCAAALESGDTPLPVRFGQAFADDRAAASGIGARKTELQARMARVSGCVEVRVVITRGKTEEEPPSTVRDAEADEPDGPGTAFLKRLARAGRVELAREVGCEEVRHAIRSTAKPLIVDQRGCETARGLSYFAVLIRRDDVTEFRDVVTNALPTEAIDLSVLGPFAPYSFAGDA